MRRAARRLGRIAIVAIVAAVVAVVLAACSKSGAGATRYHCPMHPTYVSDRPGDCPICGMRLVPIESDKAGKPAPGPAAPSPHAGHAASAPAGDAGIVYACPMNAEWVQDTPGTCPKCGMKLEPVPRSSLAANAGGTVAGRAPIDLDERGMRLAGVVTAAAERGRIERTVRTVGIVKPDETGVRHVHTKIGGWVDKLYVDFTGQPVHKGRPILSIYSPELLASQHEFLHAREAAAKFAQSPIPEVKQGADDMAVAARRRLELFDVPRGFIEELERTGKPKRNVELLAPVSGFVTGKAIFEGQRVESGSDLFTVADLSRVWIEVDVYESEAAAVRVGQEAKLSLSYDPRVRMTGKVAYIYPFLSPETRTLKVRFDFPNPSLSLKLGMYATVELGIEAQDGVIVPDSAILDTGLRQIVFANPSDGRFEPREVRVGIRADGRAQVLSGLQAGERVAVKANFLLDSESRLRAVLSAPAPAPSAPASAGP